MVGDENASVLMDLEAVGFSVILDDDIEDAIGRNAEDASERHIDNVEISRAIEARPFQKRVQVFTAPLQLEPVRLLPGQAVFVGKPGEYSRLDDLRRFKHATLC